MRKLAARGAGAGVVTATLACAFGVSGLVSSCAAVLGIAEPLPLEDEGVPDALVADATTEAPPDSQPDADMESMDTVSPDADGSSSDAPRPDADADASQTGPPNYTTSTPTPAPAFVDALSLTPHFCVLAGHDDSATSKVTLPFAFDFFGIPQSAYWANTNGVMGFDGNASNLPLVVCPLPNTFSDPYPAIYAFGDDLLFDPSGSIGVCIALTGVQPNRKLVLTWEDAQLKNYSGTSHLTFSVVLTETSNTIDLMYGTMTGGTEAQGDKATIGIEGSMPVRAYQVSCQMPVVTTTPLDLRFTPAP